MKKKYYILAFTFLCLLIGQSSFAQDWDDIIEDHSSSDFAPLDWDYINATQLKGVTVINYYYSIPIPIVSYPSYPTPSDISVEYNSGDGGSPSGWTDSNAPNTCSTICFGEYVVLDKEKCECIKLPRPWYLDNDGDGWHDGNSLIIEAVESPGDFYKKTTSGKDCDDGNRLVTSDCYKYYYIDNDGDDWDGGMILAVDDNGGKYKLTTLGTDCDDNVPSADNICGDVPCETSKGDLTLLFPNLSDDKATLLANTINKFSKFYGIDTKEKLQHFLAQAGVETDNFSSFREGTNFQPKVVMGKFGKYFNGLNNDNKNLDRANLSSIYTVGQKYVDGEKLFNIVYDDRNPNRNRDNLLGNTQDGDGYNFRGRGALHLTGRENYTKFTDFYNSISGTALKDFTKTPDDLKNNFEIAIHAGMWFFQKKVMEDIHNFQNKVTSTDPTVIEKLTIKISNKVNGGNNDLPKRENLLNDSKTKIKCN